MVIRCEGDEYDLGAIGEVLRDEVSVQFPPFFSSDTPATEKDSSRCFANRHEQGWGLVVLNAAHIADSLLNFSGIDILRRAIVVCPEGIS